MNYVELVLDDDNKLIETKRLPGENDVGMVAWKVSLNTPEYPTGQSGSNLENKKSQTRHTSFLFVCFFFFQVEKS